MTDSNKVILGLVGAAAAGVALGMLLAPEKGSDARQKIADTASDIASRVGEWVNTGKEKAQDLANTASQKAKDAAEKTELFQERMS